MSKLQNLKQAIASPPPQRLAAIEYRSHFLQMLGITVVCIALIWKGLWYIIFAFIFGLGISYSQGMAAYQKYKTIMTLVEPEKVEDYELDISPTRRRSKIVTHVFGSATKWVAAVVSVTASVLIVDPTISRWLLILLYPMVIFITYIILYFFIMYWFAYPIYRKSLKGGQKNAERRN